MRRNYASLDLKALSTSATDDHTDVDLANLDPDAASLLADVLGCDQCEQQAAAAVAHLSLDDPRGSIGCPLENMMPTDKTIEDGPARPTSPPSAVPLKRPVRRNVVTSPSLSPSSFASKAKQLAAGATPMVLCAAANDCTPTSSHHHAPPLVCMHRNVIQSV